MFDDLPATEPPVKYVDAERLGDMQKLEAVLGEDEELSVVVYAPFHAAHTQLAAVLAERFAPGVDYAALLDAARRVVQAFDVPNSPANRDVRCRDLWGAATALTALARAVGL